MSLLAPDRVVVGTTTPRRWPVRGRRRGRDGGGGSASEIATWVAAHVTATTVGGVTVYDLTSPTS